MSSVFLMSFSEAVIRRLVRDGHLELEPSSEQKVVVFVANYLGGVPQGGSLISSFSKALIACPEVEELYADNDVIKEIVDDLPHTVLPRGGAQ